ncbi:hypothetical protein AVEN_135621-1 [Araneus ventricosus]|uniref:Uncharacterized protein n=1 Tax=Araneus ventricosus TaxID=182803 RepID=A0A4Y2DQN4_ARAVE|nr:hypothetical protein AVEN_135621-1 [Araneus ventricosus]
MSLSIIRIPRSLMTVSVPFVGFGHQLFNSVPLYPDIDVREDRTEEWFGLGTTQKVQMVTCCRWKRQKKKFLSTSSKLQLLVVSQSAPVMVWFFEV